MPSRYVTFQLNDVRLLEGVAAAATTGGGLGNCDWCCDCGNSYAGGSDRYDCDGFQQAGSAPQAKGRLPGWVSASSKDAHAQVVLDSFASSHAEMSICIALLTGTDHAARLMAWPSIEATCHGTSRSRR
jgi:hypothetical protein